MRNLPLSLLIEKNKIASTAPWIILLTINIQNGTYILRFCNNTNDIVFKGQTYYAINFNLDVVKQTGKGEIPHVRLSVSNVSRLLMPYLEELSGGVGSTVKITVINANYLNVDYTELELDFQIVATEADAYNVVFTLGVPNPLSKLFPPRQYIAETCSWTFKSAECGYSGTALKCNRTFDNCQKLNNLARYGGFKGLSGVYYRFV